MLLCCAPVIHQMIDAMTTETRSRTTLISVGKQLHASPQTGQDRACLVRQSDGTERLALIQLVTSKQQGSLHRGAEFSRVSFRFVGDDSDPDCQYHLDQNTVWCVIDHKDCQIVFGPTEGIEIRQPGLGIGSYLMAQLIRLIQQSEMRGNYQVQAVHLPIGAQSKVKPEDARANDARIETFLTRVGFYVSPAAGQKVIGVRRAQDLRPWWNQQKVSFLSFPSFVELAARWQREKTSLRKPSRPHSALLKAPTCMPPNFKPRMLKRSHLSNPRLSNWKERCVRKKNNTQRSFASYWRSRQKKHKACVGRLKKSRRCTARSKIGLQP